MPAGWAPTQYGSNHQPYTHPAAGDADSDSSKTLASAPKGGGGGVGVGGLAGSRDASEWGNYPGDDDDDWLGELMGWDI